MSIEPERNNDISRTMRGRQDLPKPVKEGEVYDVTIETLGSKGDGIAKIKGLIIFIKDVKLKDQVKVKITSVRSNFATAEVIGTPSETKEENAEAEEEVEEDDEESEEAEDE